MSPSADTPSAGLRARIDRFQDWWGALPANARGSVWMILSSLTFAVMATGIKLLGQDLPVVEILFFRQMFVLLLVSPAIARGLPSVLKTRRWRSEEHTSALQSLMRISSDVFCLK